MKVIFNGHAVALPTGTMQDLPRGVRGVFETLLWRDATPQFWAEHWTRFDAGARHFDVVPDVEPETLRRAAANLAAENGIGVGLIRYAAWPGREGATVWQVEAAPPRPHMLRDEFTATWGPVLPPADDTSAYKHLGRHAWFNALIAARRAGFDEVLLGDSQGRVIEGGASNVFLVRDGILITPPLDLGPLPGVMRAAVLTMARALGWEARETTVTREDFAGASEVWLTNSLIGVKPMRSLDALVFAAARPKLEALRRAWQASYGWDPARSSV